MCRRRKLMLDAGREHVATVDQVIHEPTRLMIVALLYRLARADMGSTSKTLVTYLAGALAYPA
jgi:hypothetical protein